MAYEHKISEMETISIKDYDLMRNYFDYAEVRDLIREKPKRVRDIVADPNGIADGSCLLRIIDNTPEKLLQLPDYKKCFLPADHASQEPDGDPGLLRVDPESTEALLKKLWPKHHHILDAVRKVTYDHTAALTRDQAHELLLFCALFAYVERDPGQNDENLLTGYLKLNPDTAAVLQKTCTLLLSQKETVLPFWQGAPEKEPLKLELSVIHNTTDEQVLVRLEGCPIQRHLDAGEKLLAMTVDGAVVTFLPRFCAAREQLILREGSQVILLDGSTGEAADTLALPGDDPVLLAESRHYGLLLADRKGVFLKDLLKQSFKGGAPEKPVVWLRGDLADYGFLTQDGSFLGRTEQKAWKELLLFDISVGRGVAITRDRRAINIQGKVLAKDAADVSCCGDRWIVLKTDGSVVTDGGMLSIPSPARAVCADDQGYWIATEDRLYRRGRKEEVYELALEELGRDNSGRTVFGILTDGSFQPLR